MAVLAGLLAAACDRAANSPPQPMEQRPLFRFRHMTAGETKVDEAERRRIVQLCGAKGEVISCLGVRPGYGDLREGMLTVDFANRRFSAMRIAVKPRDFDSHYRANEWSYGPPCRSVAAADGELQEAAWCFRGGHLTLDRYAAGNMGEVRYGP